MHRARANTHAFRGRVGGAAALVVAAGLGILSSQLTAGNVARADGTRSISTSVTTVTVTGQSTTAPTTQTTNQGTTTRATTTVARQPVARIVKATVIGHGRQRTLDIRIRVSEPASARLQLLARRTRLLTKTYPLTGGSNELKTPLPATLKKGSDQLMITLTDTTHQERTYTTTILVPS
jgi:hypothetical protein